AAVVVFTLGWYVGHQNPQIQVEYVASEPEVVIQTEWRTDTVYQTLVETRTQVRWLPSDTVYIQEQVPVYITVTNPTPPQQEIDSPNAPVRLTADNPLMQLLNESSGER
ncbi:MAG TPA: hypothetical protein DCR93_33145, partial [Cytophagales bacterium]|nr:hypothetical protein [Cytophagales bacterium]